MLTLITGRAGTGKTSAVIQRINDAVQQHEGKRMLIVPEQYSHEAERELCRVCGDSLSHYAEVFSFTGLARRLMSQLGGGAVKYLDKGGRLLCMALALGSVGSRLKVYQAAARKAELQSMLLDALDELKAACISPEALYDAALGLDDSLGDKLRDLALIAAAYDAVAANGHADPADRLTVLASQIPGSDIGPDTYIYIDGFIDFTVQELTVMRALMEKGAELTVCLTVDSLDGGSEVFELSRRAGRGLIAAAEELGTEHRTELFGGVPDKAEDLNFLAENMFSYSSARFEGGSSNIELVRADGMSAECELAAAKALELVRDTGCRWRDIAVAVRGFDDYCGTLENTFQQYGVPLFTAKKSELLYKPLPLMVSLVYEITGGGWDIDDVISYMRTGLTGLSPAECDVLEAYIFKWQLRAGAWKRDGDWRQHPDGYGGDYDDEALARLEKINELRRRLADPLLNFERGSALAQTAAGQAAALAEFFGELKLPEILEARAEKLNSEGREELAQEYVQLWSIIVSALEQSAAILGEAPMDRAEFGRLFTLTLSRYDIGTIPVSLDRVSAGDFDRMRRRSIKHLIVLGASDSRLPRAGDEAGMFSDAERARLLERGVDLGGAGESELWREFTLIYNCLTLPSDSLTMICPLTDADGEEQRPAFVYNRAAALFGLEPKYGELTGARISAPAPALSLAAHAMHGGTPAEKAAAEYFKEHESGRIAALERAADMSRGKLSERAVKSLYGERLRLSASRIDKFASCKYAYFCQYGLRAKPYEPAGFTPPEIGTFMHYVLEHTAREVKKRGGFKSVDDAELGKICGAAVEAYVHEELNDFREKSARFVYLFRRLTRDVRQVVTDMADELRKSDFEPLDFELDFGRADSIPPVTVGEGEAQLTLTGVADRVDGWLHDGKLYLRVVDYKTGKKKFSMSDVWYGMGLQMLLYLFALEADGEKLYGHEIVPAGVMYVPARNAMLAAQRDMTDDEAEKKRADAKRRSGLVLDNEQLMEAWEHGAEKQYIPVHVNRSGNVSPDDVASLERLGLLARHIKKSLGEMAGELRRGSIAADPYYRGQQENACINCDYFDACHFADGTNGESCRYLAKLRPDRVWSMLEGESKDE